MNPQPVILDCDPGHGTPGADIDDAIALAMLLHSPEIDLRGVTVTAGNTDIDSGVAGALSLLGVAGRDDIPVYRGASRPLYADPEPWWAMFRQQRETALVQEIWQDFTLPPASRGVTEGDAADYIIEQVRREPGEIIIVAIGPLTNVAEAIRRDPTLPAAIQRIVAMGGFRDMPGVLRELNFSWDPDAADAVVGSGVDVAVVPFDVTVTTSFGDEAMAKLERRAHDPLTQHLLDCARRRLVFVQQTRRRAGFPLHDPLAVALLLEPSIATTTTWTAAVDTLSELANGRLVTWDPDTVQAHTATLPSRRPIAVVESTDNDRLVELVIDRIAGTVPVA